MTYEYLDFEKHQL